MRQVPGFMLKHLVTVEPFLGTNSVGEVYGSRVEVDCMFAEKNKMVRNAQGEDVSSSSSYIAVPTHRPAENSRVTVSHTGRTAKVVAVDTASWPGMSIPANTQVYLD